MSAIMSYSVDMLKGVTCIEKHEELQLVIIADMLEEYRLVRKEKGEIPSLTPPDRLIVIAGWD